MYAIIENDTVINVYTQSTPPIGSGQSVLVCCDVIPDYDTRYQYVSAPASPANAPDRYVILDDRVERHFVVREMDVATLKRLRSDEVNVLWKQKEQTSFTYEGHAFDSDEQSVIRIIGALNATECPPKWKTYDNQFVDVDAAYLQGMMDALAASANSLFVQANIHKAKINALETALEVVEYDINQEW